MDVYFYIRMKHIFLNTEHNWAKNITPNKQIAVRCFTDGNVQLAQMTEKN